MTRAFKLCAVAGVFVFLLYAIQVWRTFGIGSLLQPSAAVRLAIEAGFSQIGIKFVYFADAAAAIGGLRAGISKTNKERWLWLSTVAIASASGYFSTGRSTVLLIAVMGVVDYPPHRFKPLRARLHVPADLAHRNRSGPRNVGHIRRDGQHSG